MKALFVTAARYYYWKIFWTLHTRHKKLNRWKLCWKLNSHWNFWQNLKRVHHIRNRKSRWGTHLIESRILQREFQGLPKLSKTKNYTTSVRFVKCKYGEVISICLSIEKGILRLWNLFITAWIKKTFLKTYNQRWSK